MRIDQHIERAPGAPVPPLLAEPWPAGSAVFWTPRRWRVLIRSAMAYRRHVRFTAVCRRDVPPFYWERDDIVLGGEA